MNCFMDFFLGCKDSTFAPMTKAANLSITSHDGRTNYSPHLARSGPRHAPLRVSAKCPTDQPDDNSRTRMLTCRDKQDISEISEALRSFVEM
jgi:hypothetical protein